MNGLFFHAVGNEIITPTDELHHFSEGWRKTTNQGGMAFTTIRDGKYNPQNMMANGAINQ